MAVEMDKLDRLVAIEEIRRLKSRYFRCVDTKNWEELALLFCAEAEFDTTRASDLEIALPESDHLSRGRDAILEYIVEGMASSRSVHHGHGHEIEIVSPDEAHGIVAMEDIVEWSAPANIHLHGFGHYHETYRVEDGVWRIWRSKLTRLRIDTNLPRGDQ